MYNKGGNVMKQIIGTIICLTLLSGCAGINTYKAEWKTRIDPMGASKTDFEAHHSQCAELAYADLEQARTKRAVGTAVGAVVGAGLGLATAAILGRGPGTKVAQKVAGVGAMYGAGTGALSVKDHAYQIYGNCMVNRGYQILW